MTAKFQIIESDEFSGATIYLGSETHSVNDSNPNYEAIKAHLRAKIDDDARLLELLNPAQEAAGRLTRLSERASYSGGTLYFDGDPLDNALTEHIIRLVEAGEDDKEKGYPAFVNFLEKLYTNPSKKSRKHLFHFIESHGITIHEDGDVILYKGVRADGHSINAGYGIVDGQVYGEYDPATLRIKQSAALPNHVGAVVEIPRSMVDDDRSVGCSTGLHAGTYAYASGFAQGQLLTVKVNPRDVVSVPDDYNNAKVRVARYEVLEVNTHEYTSPVYSDESDGDFEDDEDYEDEPEVGDETVSDDDLADALAGTPRGLDAPEDEDDGSFTVTVTVTPGRAGRDAKGRFLSGPANPGKTQPRDAKGHFLPRS